ncbi:TrmB family transcriptional regulator (plasmid) [Halarchaeum sp. CBA1220]|uniref:TrmB family transcriptional regulator n=1 Tax=Halarchaeum sp. CBA1220 TaxID=1853682 RepID=UPI000F3A835A|nr:helix-turn-helix domain-containing protein [Halarchaeum sp. CBA1220]QLC35348.1 TrmB family transcriptional regulator [Halarchaeum sp. CBA1220]
MDADPVAHLREMGLSEYEADAYHGLLHVGTATAKEVSDVADVPQSRVYDVLDSLETKGFVHIQPGRPKKYGPVDPDTAVQQFCAHRRRQHDRALSAIRDHGERFRTAIGEQDLQRPSAADVDVAWSYSNRYQILDQLAELCEDATDHVLMITTPLSFERMVNHHTDAFRQSAADGVDIRTLVADDRRIDESVRQSATEWMTIRRVDTIEGRLYLYDDENVMLAFRDSADEGFVGVSTTSHHLHRTLAHLFELMWSDSRALAPEPAADTE